jgi:D-aspartate ligase
MSPSHARQQLEGARSRHDGPPATTLGGEAIALPAARSLAAAGVEVHGAGGEPVYDPVAWSRCCRSYTNLGAGDGVVERMLDWLRTDAPRNAVLMPCADDGLELCLRHGAELEEMGHVPVEANPEVLEAMLDKQATYALADGVGVATPATWSSTGAEDIDSAIARIGFPCAVKPRHSHLWAKHYRSRKLFVVEDRAGLDEVLGNMAALGLETIVTEIVPGPETDLLSHCGYLNEHGEPLTQFTFSKIRQFPIHFGIGTYVVSDWREDVIERGLEFLRAVDYRGLFHVEFKRDPRDGELKLLECNHRLTIESSFAPTELAQLAYNRVLDRPLPPASDYRSGVHLWAPYGDLRAFLAYRRRGELTVTRWLRSLMHRQRFHDFSLRDPKPGLYVHLTLLGRALRRMLGMRKSSQVET